ncbi:hypothetical protein [Actinokineospora alba]|uniref:hypothetical protein n=1 Tax=Actinokineospora alba TaxID=504798 RepID=UPI00105D1722|nr:hypothetical protein [Actinokineospora alba]
MVRKLKEKVFAEGDYYWPYDGHFGGEPLPRPTRRRKLWTYEAIQESGTHSILDLTHLIDAGEPDSFGSLRPLTAQEATAAFGTDKPTAADFERLEKAGELPQLAPRWSGVYVTLFADGKAAEIGIWGHSGD